MTPAERPRHFSMIRSFGLADFLTLGNAACGVLAVFFAMSHMATGAVRDFLIAAALAPLAFVLDVLDGKVARWRASALGARPRARFAGRRGVLRRRAGGARLRRGPARRLGHGDPRVLRLLRREPARALQRHRRGTLRRRRQGEVLRGHADPDQHRAGRRCSPGPRGRAASATRCGAAAGRSGRPRCTRSPCCSRCPAR